MRIFTHCLVATIPILMLLGCDSRSRSKDQSDVRRWETGQRTYRTSEVHTAYRVLLTLRDDVTEMEAKGRQSLNYSYCQKIVNGQLFAVAERLRETNAADSFFEQSVRFFKADRQGSGVATNGLTRDYIRQSIELYDSKTGPVFWRNNTNSPN